MMKKNIGYLCYIILFFMICSLPFIATFFHKEYENTENKILSDFPDLMEEGKFNINILSQLSDYFADHFTGRQELVTANALLTAKIFKVSSEDIIVVGNEGWLYYKASINDYSALNTASDRGVYNMAKTISLMEEYVEKHNKKFIFVIAPNKNSLYPQYMPYYYVKNLEDNNLSHLEPILDEYNINYVNLKELFLDQEEILYHKGDSHWNNKGAILVQEAILNNANKEYDSFLKKEYVLAEDFEGDLDTILYPLARNKEKEFDYSKSFSYTYLGDVKDTSDFIIETENIKKEGSLLMFRDSFGNSLLPFMAEEYKTAYFTKAVPYHVDYVLEKEVDTCVLEIVERNLNTFQKLAPVMEGPSRLLEEEPILCDTPEVTYIQEEYDGYIKVSGMVDARYTDDNSNIYIRLNNKEELFTFEAFPVYEKDITSVTTDYGYVLYIDPGKLDAGDYQIEIITSKDGKLMTSGVIGILE